VWNILQDSIIYVLSAADQIILIDLFSRAITERKIKQQIQKFILPNFAKKPRVLLIL
jgi:hypothetical protein